LTAATLLDSAVANPEQLGIKVEEEKNSDWKLLLSRYSFHATLTTTDGEQFDGYGSAADKEMARLMAVMECLERAAQFGPKSPLPSRVATAASLGAESILLENLGLYCEAQYRMSGFPCARFLDQEEIEWVEVRDLRTSQVKLIPIEFVYPRARLTRNRIVVETSSGTAAHTSAIAARLGACCELIERDSLLTFWTRQPATALLPIDQFVSPEAEHDVREMIAMGYVVVACTPTYDIDVPCVLVIALKGNHLSYGSGCHPKLGDAANHAVRELGRHLRWRRTHEGRSRRVSLSAQVRTPADHLALYDDGPFHDVFRRFLKNVVTVAKEPAESMLQMSSEEDMLNSVLERLHGSGFDVFECDITSEAACSAGATVRRLFALGLIPTYFGANMLRYGVKRQWSAGAPGRFCNPLPHFLH
jgi:ribosomal protein S12 methylthiotransferase accessory factor